MIPNGNSIVYSIQFRRKMFMVIDHFKTYFVFFVMTVEQDD
jgi:hypothetical protein